MSQHSYFKKLRRLFKSNLYKDRFLNELEAHAEDLAEEEKIKITSSFLEKKFGTPKEVKKDFSAVIGPWFLFWLFFRRHALATSVFLFTIFLLLFLWYQSESCWSITESRFDEGYSRDQIAEECKNGGIGIFGFLENFLTNDLGNILDDLGLASYTDDPLVTKKLEFCYEKRPTFFHPFQRIEYYYRFAGEEGKCDLIEGAESVFTSDIVNIKGNPLDYWKYFEHQIHSRTLIGNVFPNPVFFFIQYMLVFGSIKFFITYLKRRSRK